MVGGRHRQGSAVVVCLRTENACREPQVFRRRTISDWLSSRLGRTCSDYALSASLRVLFCRLFDRTAPSTHWNQTPDSGIIAASQSGSSADQPARFLVVFLPNSAFGFAPVLLPSRLGTHHPKPHSTYLTSPFFAAIRFFGAAQTVELDWFTRS